VANVRYSAAAVVAGAVFKSNAEVLSPNVFRSFRPSICATDNITFAIGVPSAARRWRPPFN
jgi:hypothetical protein